MRRTTIIMAIVLVASTVAAVPFTGAATHGTDTQTTTDGVTVVEQNGFAQSAQNNTTTTQNDTANASTNVTPGGQLMGVIGVQQSELNGTVHGRAFGHKMARAATNESKASVVADQATDIKEQLRELREEKRQLRKAYRNGSISTAKYHAEMAELAAETQNVRRMANATANASAGVPESQLAEKGVNVTAIQTLENEAANLSGRQVASIAHSIAGPKVGTWMADEHRRDSWGRNKHGKSDDRHGESSGKQRKSGNEHGPSRTTTGNETTTTTGNGMTTTTGNETTTTSDETTTAAGNGRDGSSKSGSSR